MFYPPIAVFALLLLSSPAYAQSQRQLFASAGSMLVGDDGAGLALSAGGEKITQRGASVGGDAVVRFGRTGFRPSAPDGEPYRQYLLSALIGAHALSASGLAPFLHGGVSLVTDPDCCGPGLGWNVGGGVNHWTNRRFGIRADVRLVLAFSGEGGLAMGRVGMVFR
jgi:hypothetical protein